MSLTSHPSEMAGNVPLILLASDTDVSGYYHAQARASFHAATNMPCIKSLELKGTSFNSARRFAVWLPTPRLSGQTRRNLNVMWDLEIDMGGQVEDAVKGVVHGPIFQVMAVSQPSRPANGDINFSAWTAQVQPLAPPQNIAQVRKGTGGVELRDIKCPGEVGVSPDAVCYLLVTMPYVLGWTPAGMLFSLRGIGVDQW